MVIPTMCQLGVETILLMTVKAELDGTVEVATWSIDSVTQSVKTVGELEEMEKRNDCMAI